MAGIIAIIRNYIRGFIRRPTVRTIVKFIIYPIIMQLIISILLVTYKLVYGGYSGHKILDLTWEFNEKTLYWPGVKNFEFTKTVGTKERGYWYASNEFVAAEHGGTHLDAPFHFVEEGWKVADIPVDRFFANAILVDFSSEVEAAGADYTVDANVLKTKLNSFEPIPNNTVVLLKFGWSQYWPDKEKYMRFDEKDEAHFPGLDRSSAAVIANDTRIVGVGTDTSSIDTGKSTEFEAHRTLLQQSIYILENVKMIENLPDKIFTVVVAPVELTAGSGAPARIFAVLT